MRTTAFQGLELVPAALILGQRSLRQIPGYFTSASKSCLFADGFKQLIEKLPGRAGGQALWLLS